MPYARQGRASWRGQSRSAGPAARATPRSLATVVALGVVFGDIGTSPLYAVQTVFDPSAARVVPVEAVAVYGVASLIV